MSNNCTGCLYLKGYRKPYNKRAAYYCSHPNQRYIAEYYRKNKLKSMPGFLGFGELSLPRKRIPKWCPLAESKDGE